MYPLAIIFVFVGLFSVSGAVYNWDWFMNTRKARVLVRALSRTGARFFYGGLGAILVVIGLLAGLGVIEVAR
jgi:hypothetical protein